MRSVRKVMLCCSESHRRHIHSSVYPLYYMAMAGTETVWEVRANGWLTIPFNNFRCNTIGFLLLCIGIGSSGRVSSHVLCASHPLRIVIQVRLFLSRYYFQFNWKRERGTNNINKQCSSHIHRYTKDI